MATETERKFLVSTTDWPADAPSTRFRQGYLSQDPARCVRVRVADDEAWLTIKGRSHGISRAEFEYSIPSDEALALLELCLPHVIDKTRHRVEFLGHLWEIDVFHGALNGLVLAEVELDDPSIQPPLPPWVGIEVSHDPRYFNSNLAQHGRPPDAP